MNKKEFLPYSIYKCKTENDIATNLKVFQDFEDMSQLTSPRSAIDYKLDDTNNINQFLSSSGVPILSQSSFDSNNNNLDQYSQRILKNKKRLNNLHRFSLAHDYKQFQQSNESVNFKENMTEFVPSKKGNNLSYDKLYQSLSSSTLLNQSQTNRQKQNPLSQSISLKNESPFYDYNEKKEFFRAIKFNLNNKRRGGGSNLSFNAEQNLQKSKSLKQISQSGENGGIFDKKIVQLSQLPYLEASPNDSDQYIYSDTPYQIEKVKIINAKPSSENSSCKFLNKQTQNSLQIPSKKKQYIPSQYFTPQSKHQNSVSSRSQVITTFSDSIDSSLAQNAHTPLTIKEKKYNDRIQKIMSFNLAKEMNNIVSTIKKQKHKEQNPSILKLPSIKNNTLPIQSETLLQDKKPQLESLDGINMQLSQIQNLQKMKKEGVNKHISSAASGMKKKQVHFIIDDSDSQEIQCAQINKQSKFKTEHSYQ